MNYPKLSSCITLIIRGCSTTNRFQRMQDGFQHWTWLPLLRRMIHLIETACCPLVRLTEANGVAWVPVSRFHYHSRSCSLHKKRRQQHNSYQFPSTCHTHVHREHLSYLMQFAYPPAHTAQKLFRPKYHYECAHRNEK